MKVWILFCRHYLFRPQKSTSDSGSFFHFFSVPFSVSLSRVTRAFTLSSVVISKYLIVVSICSWPRRNWISTILNPSSIQCEAFACLNKCACAFRGTSLQWTFACAAYVLMRLSSAASVSFPCPLTLLGKSRASVPPVYPYVSFIYACSNATARGSR